MTVPFKTQYVSQQNISSANIIDRTITTADIALATIDISNLSASCIASLGGGLTADSVNSSHIINFSILGIDISLGQISEAHFDASFTAQLSAFSGILNSLYTGVFELICNTTINVDFYYEEGGDKIYLFQFEEVETSTTYLKYSLPLNFASLTFFLASDQAIQSYSLTYASPTNGIVSHSQVGAGKIQFNILRNSQHYLELDIDI